MGIIVMSQMKIGKQGDFYTSSSIGTIMGEMIAHLYDKQLNNSLHYQSPSIWLNGEEGMVEWPSSCLMK